VSYGKVGGGLGRHLWPHRLKVGIGIASLQGGQCPFLSQRGQESALSKAKWFLAYITL
jgi:preprotein translocase subunit SecG